MEVFWHDACLEHDPGSGLWELPGQWDWLDVPEPHPESADRLRTFRHALRHGPVARHLTWSAGRFAGDDELARVHTPEYLGYLRDACRRRTNVEVNTAVGPGSWDAVRAAAGTALAAYEAVAEGRARLAYALVRPPGHHAQPGLADGYCLVNNAALVAETARRAGRRVAVLDWDVHHGNGTQEVFRDTPDVLTVSVHMRHGPWGANHAQTGGPEESGPGNVNVELSLGAGDHAYRRAFEEVALPAVAEFGADLLVCASGFDGSAFDPNGRHNLTAAGYRWIGGAVAGLGLPAVLTQEGGYLRGYAALCLHALVEGLLGLELLDDPLAYVPDDAQLVDADLARARSALTGWAFARAVTGDPSAHDRA
ncbi:histone deacetylase [Saccharothrix yanglingensis]|uniref:Histone deacetylase n=1 Tax=Saccharothrix yanglingensis TaxID=659496 RepID=A0ABU0WRJ9_9PSEU|nr:histone deacetylase [Saccharothrix yanglingensis]MDQ2582460.1 histone deacetylase [Saccharothrix yanglingensis]